LINFSLSDLHIRARGLYASSGDLQQISNLIDDQASTTYEFSATDPAPAALIDLGHERSLSRISAIFAAQPGAMEFYVLKTLPNDAELGGNDIRQIANDRQPMDSPNALKVSEKTLAQLKAVGSVDGGNGRAAVDFPAVSGRYLMLKWQPAAASDKAFSIAQVAAFGPVKHGESAVAEEFDGKDGKGLLGGGKEAIGEGPEEPGEGPAPGLPPVAPFTFIPQVPPQVAPVSP
jgi:hypothetical protein